MQFYKKFNSQCLFRAAKKRDMVALRFGSMAERVGFEPTAPCGITGFQDRLLKPLGHLSKVVTSLFYRNRCQKERKL